MQLSNRALRSPLTFQDVDGAIGLSDRDKVFFFAYELWWHLIPDVLELTTGIKVCKIVELCVALCTYSIGNLNGKSRTAVPISIVRPPRSLSDAKTKLIFEIHHWTLEGRF